MPRSRLSTWRSDESLRLRGPDSRRRRIRPCSSASNATVRVPPPSIPRKQTSCPASSPPITAGMLADSARQRQVEAERRALSNRALHFNRAAVPRDEFTHNRQAESRAFLLARKIRVENLAEVLGGDAGTVVRHGDLCERLRRIKGLRAKREL